MAEYPDAISYYVDSSRVFVGQNSHRAIVVHGTGGAAHQTAQQLGDYFRTNSSGVSSHFGIDRAGVICQYVSLTDGAAANCCLESGYDPFWDQFGGQNLNCHTISIEHVNDSTNSLSLTSAQQDASFKLIAWLCERYNLGVDRIKTHQSIAPSSRARCPGAAFPMNALKAYLSGGTMAKWITQAARDTWNSTAFLFGGQPLPYTTGIALSWQQLYVQKQKTMPPPTTREFDSVDWVGNPIAVQCFGNLRCEWNKKTNTPAWFNANGGIK
jgi:N-acetyl-anhydromuramyl-L-alanine amidase AmpD